MSRRTFHQRVATAIRVLREKGPRAFLSKLYSARKGQVVRPVSDFGFLLSPAVGPKVDPTTVGRNTVNWVVPPFSAGAGGHTTIFRIVHFLEQQGFECRIVVQNGLVYGSSETFRALIRESFFPLKAQVYVDIEQVPPAYITVATGWESAYLVRGLQSTVHKCYFVQDFEPWFYAVGSEHCFAEQTYRFGFRGITAGAWLSETLQRKYGMRADPIGFSCDKTVYFVKERAPAARKKVFFYARPSTERRAFELGLMTLAELHRKMPEVTVVLAGGDLSRYEIPFPHTSAGVVNVRQLADIFRECDAALVLSLTNVSLLPVELMACGTPVVSNTGPYVEWLLNSRNSFLANPTIPELSDALRTALTDEAAANSVRDEGLRLAAASSWELEAQRMGDIFRSLEDE